MRSNFDKDLALVSYANDVMISAKANIKNVVKILDSLDKFKLWTGLQINVNKSHIMFLPSINSGLKNNFIHLLRFKVILN